MIVDVKVGTVSAGEMFRVSNNEDGMIIFRLIALCYVVSSLYFVA